MGTVTVAERLDALAAAVRAGRDVLPDELADRARAIEDRAGHRLRLSGDHTVVALAGATGSGKSSLLNALVGSEIARADVLRPTTSEALAVIRRDEGSGELLDWLGVRSRHVLDDAVLGQEPGDGQGRARFREAFGRRGEPGGLIVLDLPDHDSVVVEHRQEAERLVALVDLMVWVVDPQKYADAAIHERYLRGLRRHREVMLVVLNQVDRLDPEQRRAVEHDLTRLLEQDGLAGVPVLGVSARTGEGVDGLRTALEQAARRREAARARTEADVADVATDVVAACGTSQPVPREAVARLSAELERAAGVSVVVGAVRASWLTRAHQATGWPPTRWLARWRPDPLRRLHLDGRSRDGEPLDPEVVRTSLPAPGPAEAARARGAVRAYVDAATAGAPDRWVLAAREAAGAADLPAELDGAVAGTPLVPSRRPLWWTLWGSLQWLFLLVMLGGVLWLAVLWALAALQMPVLTPPQLGWTYGDQAAAVPWPTVLAVGGAVVGLLLAALGRLLASVGARRQARAATARLRSAVQEVADRSVVRPVAEVRDRQAECHSQARRALGERPR